MGDKVDVPVINKRVRWFDDVPRLLNKFGKRLLTSLSGFPEIVDLFGPQPLDKDVPWLTDELRRVHVHIQIIKVVSHYSLHSLEFWATPENMEP
jgi:hypothetical protein